MPSYRRLERRNRKGFARKLMLESLEGRQLMDGVGLGPGVDSDSPETPSIVAQVDYTAHELEVAFEGQYSANHRQTLNVERPIDPPIQPLAGSEYGQGTLRFDNDNVGDLRLLTTGHGMGDMRFVRSCFYEFDTLSETTITMSGSTGDVVRGAGGGTLGYSRLDFQATFPEWLGQVPVAGPVIENAVDLCDPIFFHPGEASWIGEIDEASWNGHEWKLELEWPREIMESHELPNTATAAMLWENPNDHRKGLPWTGNLEVLQASGDSDLRPDLEVADLTIEGSSGDQLVVAGTVRVDGLAVRPQAWESAVTSARLYLSAGPELSDRIGDHHFAEVPIRWNTRVADFRVESDLEDMLEAIGADALDDPTHIIVVVNEDNAVVESRGDQKTNWQAVELTRNGDVVFVTPTKENVFFEPIQISSSEQAMIETINGIRQDPREWERYSDLTLNEGLPPGTISGQPLPPLAPHQGLSNAAAAHTQDMLDRNYFAHVSPEGSTLGDRATDIGYEGNIAENIGLDGYAYAIDDVVDDADERRKQMVGTSVVHHLMDSAPHRANLLGDYDEIGVGIDVGDHTFSSGNTHSILMATQMFGAGAELPFLTGVAFDNSHFSYYLAGNGLEGVRVSAINSEGQRFETLTGPSGGYAIPLPEGDYRVAAYSPDQSLTLDLGSIVITDHNLKLDVLTPQFDEATSPTLFETRLDVSGDSRVTALDALRIINALNSLDENSSDERLDVSGDGRVTALDALQVINHLGNRSQGRSLVAGESTNRAGGIVDSDARADDQPRDLSESHFEDASLTGGAALRGLSDTADISWVTDAALTPETSGGREALVDEAIRLLTDPAPAQLT